MVVIRPTRKLHRTLPVSQMAGASDTALGDWYVNRLVVDRQPLLLLVSAASLLPVLVRARNVRDLPTHIREIVARRLARLSVPEALIDDERRAMAPAYIGATVDRSVLGIMVDFAKGVSYSLASGFDDAALARVEAQLGRTPCHAGKAADRVIFPDRKAPELLIAKWSSV
jgi:uncharacterized protein DUF6933